MEPRVVLTAVPAGNYSGNFSSNTEFLDTSGTYVIDGSLTVLPGVALTVGPNVKVLIKANQTLTINGSASFGNKDTVTLDASPYASTTRLVVNGTLTADHATFASSGSHYRGLIVNSGGRMTASDSNFSLSEVAFDDGAIINNTDLARNAFDATLTIPVTDVKRLSAAEGGSDNRRFQQIHIRPGTLTSGTVHLGLIGTETTANLQWVFASNFTVGSGATLNVSANLPLYLYANQTLTINGALNLASGDTFTLDASPYASQTKIVVNGTLTAADATFASSGSYYKAIIVNSGGRMTASDSTFSLSEVAFDDNAIIGNTDLAGNVFDATLTIPITAVNQLSAAEGGSDNLRFQQIHIRPGTLASDTVHLDLIGTETTANLRWVFAGNFTVAGGATLDVRPNVSLVLSANQTLTIDGELKLASGDTFTLDASPYASQAKIIVNGSLAAANMTFASSGSYYKAIIVNSGGSMLAFGNQFYVETNLGAGAIANWRHNKFIGANVNIDGSTDSTVDIRYNNFSSIAPGKVAIGISAVDTYDIKENFWGVQDSAAIDALITDDEESDGARPQADFSNPIPTGNVGRQVWYDANHNSIYDVDEAGVPGILVKLFDASDDTQLGSTLTDSDGLYSFTNLPGVPYYLTFTRSDVQRQVFVTPNVDNDYQDSDANANGETAVFSISSSTYDYHEDAGLWISEPPVLSGLSSASYQENQPPVGIGGAANVADPDSSDFDGGTLTATITEGGESTDRLSIISASGIATSGDSVLFNETLIGTFSGGEGSSPLVVALNAAATPVAVQALVNAIGFSSTSDGPSDATRILSVQLADGDGGTSSAATVSIAVMPINDAPQLDNTLNPTLVPTAEDAVSPGSTLVSALIAGAVADPDANAQRGIAVTSASNLYGVWQFSLNSGSTWTGMGTPSNTASLLLPDSARLRFLPSANFNGQVKLWFRAWDRTLGVAGGTLNTSGNMGGIYSLSTAADSASLTIKPVNDAPVLNAALSPVLATINEDATSPASTSVATLLNGAVLDVDANALTGIAVTGAAGTNGTWQYSLNNGTTWSAMGSPSGTAARLLPSSARVRFIPKPNFNGVVTLYYRAWDQTQGSSGGTLNASGNLGGTKSLSVAHESAPLIIKPVNDKPALSGISGNVNYVRNTTAIVLAPFGKVADVDSANFAGGRLRVRIDSADASNRLAVGGAFKFDGSNNVLLDGVVIGSRVSNGFGTRELIITFKTTATKAIVQQLVRAITFKTVGGLAGQRRVVFTVSDGDGGLSAEVTKTVNVS